MGILNKKLNALELSLLDEGKGLEGIFSLQRDLMEGYIKCKALPEYPIDLSLRDSQKTIRHITGAFIEELSEAFTEYEKLFEAINANSPNIPRDTKMTDYLAAMNEEIADSLHFFIELLIYANIDEGSIKAYYSRMLKEELIPESIYNENNTLATILQVSIYSNNKSGHNQRGYNVKLLRPDQYGFEDNNCTLGFRVYHPSYFLLLKDILWTITNNLYKAQNSLKAKAWRKQETKVDLGKFQLDIMECFLSYFCLIAFLGISEEAIFEVYCKKNKINFDRQNNNY